ncbi:MAG: hypothetical protein QGG71_02010 [Pirellulaceae bacterium]|jgi:hypothetical protein|nr:hypothetical protein [Pirellulaceae bacterium]
MKNTLLCMSVLVLASVAFAVPLTGASDTAKRDTRKRQQRDDAGAVRVAQAQSKKQNSPNRNAANRTSAAQKQSAKNATAAKSKRLVPITAETEAHVGKFVREHHRELCDVLARLKENVPKEYERAVRELDRNRLRLKQFEGRDRYPAELKLWKAQSRARLLGARLQMGGPDDLRDALRKTLAEVYDLRATLLQRDRDRTAERLKRLDEQLQSIQKDRDKTLEKQLLSLTKATQKRDRSVKPNARKAKPATSKKTSNKKSSTKAID